jgi:hypothetical protein
MHTKSTVSTTTVLKQALLQAMPASNRQCANPPLTHAIVELHRLCALSRFLPTVGDETIMAPPLLLGRPDPPTSAAATDTKAGLLVKGAEPTRKGTSGAGSVAAELVVLGGAGCTADVPSEVGAAVGWGTVLLLVLLVLVAPYLVVVLLVPIGLGNVGGPGMLAICSAGTAWPLGVVITRPAGACRSGCMHA